MEKLTTVEIRKRFLEHFEKNNHLTIGASSLLPKNDPTLLFINSGMAPLKNYFLGTENPPSPRMANFQPCIRTKDIDDVGDRHHLTLFEMMGSWSIGDYFKEEACKLAFELLVDGLGFDPKKLYMSVYGGNKKQGIAADTQSIEAWKKCGVVEDHIVVLGQDNFWGPAGITGPCGPCTEVFYDTGEEFGEAYTPGGHFDDVGRYIEIWNAGVFMELDKQKDGSFNKLPFKSVDTGSGLERMAMVMGGYESVYETDLLAPLVEIAKKLYGTTENHDGDKLKIRMISDHMRAAVMILAEGVIPSNEGQGYIPRRLIRKVIAALTSVHCKKIDFTEITEKVIELQAPFYPRMESSKDFIFYNLKAELQEFLPVINEGLKKIDEEIQVNHKKNGVLFSGKLAFELVTTFGLPLEVIVNELKGRSIELDQKSYDKSYEQHRKTSRVISRKGGETTDTDKIKELLKNEKETEFVGYNKASTNSKILKMIIDSQLVDEVNNRGQKFYFITESSPFYAESGGQSGDSGKVSFKDGQALVLDTLKISNRHVHLAELISGKALVNEVCSLSIDEVTRKLVAGNHSATHLLHAALHAVVGKHAVQKGSSVRTKSLRFDFVHHQALTNDEISKIEKKVNDMILSGSEQMTEVLPYDQALKKGAMALFGEKYEGQVRMVSFEKESIELCGGTHVKNTSEIGPFMIKSVSSVAKGIRRIEAVTGACALDLIYQRNQDLKAITVLLGVKSEHAEAKIKELMKKAKAPKKEVTEIKSSNVKFIASFEDKRRDGVEFFMGVTALPTAQVKILGDRMIDKGPRNMICLIAMENKSLKIFTWVHKKLLGTYKAGDLLKAIISPFEGRGGGRPAFAQGGISKDCSGQEVLSQFQKNIKDFY